MSEKYDIVWNKEKKVIDLGLDRFGVVLEALQPDTVCPNIILRCWIKDKEFNLLKKNDFVEKHLLEK